MTDVPAGKVPVIACVVASWKFLFDTWRQFLPAALIVGVALGVSRVLLAGGGLSPGEAYLFALLGGLAGVLFAAVALRKAVRGEFLGPAGIAFGQDEARLFAILLSMALLFMPAIFVSGIIYFFILVSSMGLTPEQMEEMSKDPVAAQASMQKGMENLPNTSGGGALAILAILALCLALLIAARFWVINAASIGERKIVFFQTWGWSKGNVIRIAAAILMTWLPAQIVAFIGGELLDGIAGAAPNAIMLTITGAISFTLGAYASVPSAALSAELYRGLRPPGFVAK